MVRPRNIEILLSRSPVLEQGNLTWPPAEERRLLGWRRGWPRADTQGPLDGTQPVGKKTGPGWSPARLRMAVWIEGEGATCLLAVEARICSR